MPARHYFTEEKTRKLTNTTQDFIVFDKVKPGMEHHYEHVAAMNDTTSFTSLKFGVRKGSKNLFFEDDQNPTLDIYYSIDRALVVSAGDQLIVAFDGITASDICHVNVNGFRVKVHG